MAGFALSIASILDDKEYVPPKKYRKEDIDFGKHVEVLSSIFNELEKIRLGNIFSDLYDICIKFFDDVENAPVFISINDDGSIQQNSEYDYKNKRTLLKTSDRNTHYTKTTEIINKYETEEKSTFSFKRTSFIIQDKTFIKKYNLEKNNIYDMNHGIIFVLHEICVQYYAYILSKEYNRPTNTFEGKTLETFEIKIPEIYGLYLSHNEVDKGYNECVIIEIHSEYVLPNTDEDTLSIKTLKPVIPHGNIEHGNITDPKIKQTIKQTIKRMIKYKKTYPPITTDIESTEALRKRNSKSKENNTGSQSTRRKRDNIALDILKYEKIKIIIMLHNTIVQFFKYLKRNSLLHLDSSLRNIYFHENQLVIIDFGESYISIHRKKSYKSSSKRINKSGNILYVKPEFQRDGYPISKVIEKAKEYAKLRQAIDVWLFEVCQDFRKCYGGGLKKKKLRRLT